MSVLHSEVRNAFNIIIASWKLNIFDDEFATLSSPSTFHSNTFILSLFKPYAWSVVSPKNVLHYDHTFFPEVWWFNQIFAPKWDSHSICPVFAQCVQFFTQSFLCCHCCLDIWSDLPVPLIGVDVPTYSQAVRSAAQRVLFPGSLIPVIRLFLFDLLLTSLQVPASSSNLSWCSVLASKIVCFRIPNLGLYPILLSELVLLIWWVLVVTLNVLIHLPHFSFLSPQTGGRGALVFIDICPCRCSFSSCLSISALSMFSILVLISVSI